jgi:minor extracellular serine protease Vpr
MLKNVLFAVVMLMAVIAGDAESKTLQCTGKFDIFKNPIVVTKENLAKVTALPDKGKVIRILSLIDPVVFSETELNSYGWRVVSRRGTIATLSGNETSAPYLSAIKGICWVQRYYDHSYASGCLDTARRMMAVDKVNGFDRAPAPGILRAFRGKNVLFGIIDIEFDTHHPAFLDAQKKTRFIALWDQDTSSTKRIGTAYGRIKTGEDLDHDSTFGLINSPGHGTGMASFAVGSDTSLPYFGIAPEAMIIGVKYNRDYVEQDVVNGLFWIDSMASALHVPYVVSLSIGLASGPHDGTSLVDQAIDLVSDTMGHVVVGAIGNDGDRRSHISFQLSSGEAKGSWVVPVIDSLQNPPRAVSFSGVDMWGESGKIMSVGLNVLDDRTNTFKTSGISLTTQQSHYYRDTLTWQDSITKAIDTLFFTADVERSSTLNRKPHMTVAFYSINPHLSLGIKVSLLNNASGVVHAWNLEKIEFKSYGMSGFFDGDSLSTLNEVGGTAKSIICVGSYINKSKVITYNGSVFDKMTENNIGNLTNFSGTGPTVDGRIKPDICAPGDMVIGAMSRRDPYNWQTSVWPDTHSTNGRYVRATGTSVSSPLVAGVVALLLEASPKLRVDSVKSLLASTAIKDRFTGALPTPDNRWGAGKINAYGALAKLLGTNATGGSNYIEAHEKFAVTVTIRSMARKQFLVIHSRPQGSSQALKVTLFDGNGHRLFTIESFRDRILLPERLAKGVYLAHVLCNGQTARYKLALW